MKLEEVNKALEDSEVRKLLLTMHAYINDKGKNCAAYISALEEAPDKALKAFAKIVDFILLN